MYVLVPSGVVLHGRFAKCFQGLTQVTLQHACELGIILVPILSTGKLRDREVGSLTVGPTEHKWHLTPSILSSDLVPLAPPSCWSLAFSGHQARPPAFHVVCYRNPRGQRSLSLLTGALMSHLTDPSRSVASIGTEPMSA